MQSLPSAHPQPDLPSGGKELCSEDAAPQLRPAQCVDQTCHRLHPLLIISSALSFRMDYECAGFFNVCMLQELKSSYFARLLFYINIYPDV